MRAKNLTWRNLSGQRSNAPIEEILEQAILKELANGNALKICVGSDSQVYNKRVEYATVVVVIRKGRGGFMFIRNEKEKHNRSIKERMIHEVSKSVEVAYAICGLLDRYGIELEVHADINTNPQFKSNVALKEAMGYILGMGFVFKAKPHAFAGSSCANKAVR